jgi:hypothetical protein
VVHLEDGAVDEDARAVPADVLQAGCATHTRHTRDAHDTGQ